jgi:SAM-dependent methyltransferase
MSDRLEREREFHDARFGDHEEDRPSDRFYRINAASDRYYRDVIDRLPEGSKVLDYGCGAGAYCAYHAAKAGHDVTAVDLSPVAIEQAREQAEAQGLADGITFMVMNAEELSFPDDSFDAVGGLGVLHHLNLAAAIDNVARVLKPDGLAFFVEPLGHNPAINLFRKRTPEQRTPDEHPLVVGDLDFIRGRFARCDATFFHLLSLLAIPVMNRSFADALLRRLDRYDQALFRSVKPSRRYAWMVGLELSGPLAKTSGAASGATGASKRNRAEG